MSDEKKPMKAIYEYELKTEYFGLTYEQASRKAEQLLRSQSHNWAWVLDDLLQLRDIMQSDAERRAREQSEKTFK